MHNRPDYRIRPNKKTEDDFQEQIEEQLKLSTHLKGQRRENSAALVRKPHESGTNSRLGESRTGSGIGSMVGSRVGRVLRMSKADKNTVTDIEFNNVRWISIVSAYDSKRLRHVTVSKQSCEAFLKRYGYGIKKDPAAMAYLRDIKRHFHSWLAKINQAFTIVLDHFLSVNQKSPLMQLQEVGPTLEEIRSDTAMMRQKLEGCLKIYENNDFRKLSERFQGFFTYSKGLEELIAVIFQSKQRIDGLFVELEESDHMDKKVEKIRKEGVKQAKKLVYQEGDFNRNLCERIMEKVSLAINDMAVKSMDVFNRIQGARDILGRLRKLLNDSHRRGLTLAEIRTLSKIFKEIIDEAEKFQKFAENYGSEGELISAELKQKIRQYQDDIEDKKRAVSEIQVLFVSTVINETIDTLKHNFNINNCLEQSKAPYQEFNHILEEISDAMLDQTRKASVDGLVKHGRTAFTRLDQVFEKIKRTLRRNEDGVVIDTEEGLISVDCYVKEIKDYKDKIKNLIKKHEDGLRHLQANFKEVRLPNSDKDQQMNFLLRLAGEVEVINGRDRKNKLAAEKGFLQLRGGVAAVGAEAQQAYFLMQQLEESKQKINNLNESNPLPNLIKSIHLENNIYLQSSFINKFFEICSKTVENNLIQQLSKLNDINSKRKQQLEKNNRYHVTKSYQFLVDRIYCFVLVKGLKKNVIKELDDNKNIVFPNNEFQTKQMENEIKYRGLLIDNLGDGSILAKSKIKSAVLVMKDMVGSYRIVERLHQNENGQFFVLVETLANFASQMFKVCLLSDSQDRSTECRKISFQMVKSLKNKLNNIELLDKQIDIQTHQAVFRVRKEILHYQQINQTALKAGEELTKPQNTDPLSSFSSFIHALSEYILESKQISYIALNEFKQPIWIGIPQQSVEGLVNQINLKGYKRGIFVDQYSRQAPKVKSIQVKPEISPLKESKSGKKEESPTGRGTSNIKIKVQTHPQEDMDEEIPVQSDKEDALEDMAEEMGDEINDEPAEQMVEEMEQAMPDQIGDQMGEDIVNDEEENMGEQIDDYEATPKKSSKIEEKSVQKSQIKEKPVQVIKQQPKKLEPVLSKYEKSIYEIIPFFKELSSMKELFAKINTSEHNFWSSQVDFGEVEDFYHRNEDSKDRASFIKSLQNSFVVFANQNFGTPLSDEIKKLDRFRALKDKFNVLGSKDWAILFAVLELIQLNYSLLYKKGGKDEILQIFIGNRNGNEFRKQGNKKCITNYLQRTFKSSYYFPAMFNTQNYINYCFKQETLEFINANGVSFHYVVKYMNKFNESLPANDTHATLKALQDLEHRFTQQFVTGVDLHHFCLQLWLKAIDSQAEDHYKPDYSILAEYTNKLNSLEKKEWIANYLTEFNKQANEVKSKVKSFKNSLENILFKVDSENIFECITQIAGIFKKTLARQVYAINSSGKEELVFVSSSQKVSAVFQQSQSLTVIESCLSRNEEKGNKVIIKLSEMIRYIQKLFSQGVAKTDNLPVINELLNILQIEHFYICQPEFLIKEKLDDIVFRILKHLRVKSREELEYDQMFKDIFVVAKKECTSEVKLKPTFNKKMLTQDYIAAIEDRTSAISKQLTIHQESFKNALLNNKMSALMFSKIVFKREENPIIKELASFKLWLNSKKGQIQSQLSNKSVNPLAYVHINCKNIENININVNRQIGQIQSLQQPTKNGNLVQQIRDTHKLIEQIKLWLSAKGIVNTSSSFYAVIGDEKWIMGVDLNKSKTDKSRAKQFLIEILDEQWLSTSKQAKKEWLQIFEFFYGQYVQENVSVEKRDGHVDFNFDFKAVSKAFFTDVRLDLVQTEDIILFSKNYNLHRFNSSNATVEKLKHHHTKIIKRLLLRLSLLKVKELVKSCEWTGLNKLETSRSLLDCAVKEIDQELEQLEQFIRKTQEIKLKQTDLSEFSEWYKNLAVKKLGFHYYQLKSSEGELITILPMVKIEKDKSKNGTEINSMLADIKLPPNYSIKLQQGISVIHLQNEKIICNLVDNEHYLTEDSQLDTFQPEIAESEMLLLAFYQVETGEEVIPLFIGEIKLKVECNLTITECYTISSVTGAIWKIAREDYQKYRAENHTDTKESLKILKKKIRGAASPNQKMKQVYVGQTLNFVEVGGWLREELKNHHRRVEEKERAEQERRRIQAMLKKEAEDFLANIYEGLDKQNLPVLKFTLEELQAIREKKSLTRPKRFNTYSQRIVEKTNKIIEDIEQNKSREQVGRLSAITKNYIKALEQKLIINHDIENEMFESADKKFKVIMAKREKEEEQRRKKEEEEKKKKEEERKIREEAKKQKAEAKRLKQQEAKRLKEEKKKKELQELKKKEEQLKQKLALEAEKAQNSLNVNPNLILNGEGKPQQPDQTAKLFEYPKIQTFSPQPADPNPIQTNEPEQDAEQISSDQQQIISVEQKKQTPIEPKEIHTEDLVLEHESSSGAKSNRQQYDSYLIEILEDRVPKDADYYRCIISSFWQLTVQERQSVVLLH